MGLKGALKSKVAGSIPVVAMSCVPRNAIKGTLSVKFEKFSKKNFQLSDAKNFYNF